MSAAALTPKLTNAQQSSMLKRIPGLMNSAQMRLVVSKERFRSDRYAQYFSLIIAQLHCSKAEHHRKLKSFTTILDKRLRFTDEKGLLADGQIAIVLPMTDHIGVLKVLAAITTEASRSGVLFRAKVVTYPEKTEHNKRDVTCDCSSELEQNIDSDSDIDEEESVASELSSVLGSRVFFQSIPVTCNSVTVAEPFPYIADRYPLWKRSFDIAAATTGLVLACPVIFVSAIAIKFSSPGPVFFKQPRAGQHGKTFEIIKLRTMIENAESLKGGLQESNERDGPAFKMKNDPRVTRVGRLLRSSGLDELPQLINVLKGEMAIVGPRPLPCDEDRRCEPWHRRRLDTKPGITCYWQIAKTRKITFAEWMRMDLRYGDRRSILGDISLVFQTVFSVLLGRVGH